MLKALHVMASITLNTEVNVKGIDLVLDAFQLSLAYMLSGLKASE